MSSFVTLVVAYTLSQFYRSFLAVVAGPVASDLGLNAAQLGNLSATWFVVFALAQFPIGYALDRWGPRRTLAWMMLAAVAGAALFAMASSYGAALFAMALIGLGCAPVLMASMYVFARDYAFERFASLSTTLIGLGTLGNLIGSSPLALAAQSFGWRTSMLGIAALTAGSAAVCWLVVRDGGQAGPQRADQGILGGLGTIARIPTLWLIYPLALVSYAVVIATRSLWIAPFLSSVHQLDPTTLGHAVLAMALTMSLGSLAYGPVERRLGQKTTVLAGCALTGSGFVALGLWGADSTQLAVVLLAAIGWFGTTYAILMAHARLFMPAHLLGRGVTFLNFAFIGGGGLVQWVSGRFVQASFDAGLAPTLVYERLFLGFGLVLLAATAIYLLTPRRAPQEARERS